MATELLRSRLFDPDIQFLIRDTARRLTRARGFWSPEFDDLVQELVAHLLHRLPAYDPGRSPFYCFAQVVLDRQAKTLIEHRNAACRNPARVERRNAPQSHPGEEFTCFVASLPAGIHAHRFAQFDLPDEERQDIVIDVQDVLARLPEEVQEFARRRSEDTLAQIARNTDTSAYHLRQKQAVLRRALEAAGLGPFLSKTFHDA